MEIKKSHQADLNNRRTTNFMLGLALALAALFVALEYTSSDSGVDTEEALLEELAQDLMVAQAPEQRDMEAAVVPERKPDMAERLNIVDEAALHEDEKPMEPQPVAGLEGEPTEPTGLVEDMENQQPLAIDENEKPISWRVVEQLPEFPGGMSAFVRWLNNNLKYPRVAQGSKIQGRVVVSFIVNKDGTTSDAKVLKSANEFLDGESMRVIRMMPKWKPGEDHGKPCRTMVAVPIVFQL